MWKVATKMQKDGYCEIDGPSCGYCERCRYLYSARPKKDKELSHTEWAKRNYILMMEMKMDREKQVKEVRAEVMARRGEVKHEFWTIALPIDYNLVTMVEKSWDMMDKDLFKMGDSIACYEYHSKERPAGGNLHIHILVIRHGTYKPSKKIEMMAKHFGIAKNFIDKAPFYKGSDFENRLNYILGKKIDEDKKTYVERDRQWREDEGLPEFTCCLPDVYRIKYNITEGLN